MCQEMISYKVVVKNQEEYDAKITNNNALCKIHHQCGTCSGPPGCSLDHLQLENAATILIKNCFKHPKLLKDVLSENVPSAVEGDVGGEDKVKNLKMDYETFYDDLISKLRAAGPIMTLKCCVNKAKHLRGNVYVCYESHSYATLAVAMYNDFHYKGKAMEVVLSPVVDWKSSVCKEYMMDEKCTRGENCTFLHIMRNPRGEYQDYGDHQETPFPQIYLKMWHPKIAKVSHNIRKNKSRQERKEERMRKCGFSRTAICILGSSCTDVHIPHKEETTQIVIRNLFHHPQLMRSEFVARAESKLLEGYVKFYHEAYKRFSSVGKIVKFRCCRNPALPLRGTVYIEYADCEAVTKAVKTFDGESYDENHNSQQISVEQIPKIDWYSAVCGRYAETNKCTGSCRLLHLFRNPRIGCNNYAVESSNLTTSHMCSSYMLSGACEFSYHCTFQHPLPEKSALVLLPNFFQHPAFLDEQFAVDLTTVKSFREFYDDFIERFREVGPVLMCKCLLDRSEHLKGNFYVQYSSHEHAVRAIEMLEPNFALLCYQIDWPNVLCEWPSAMCLNDELHKGGQPGEKCNLLHAFRNPRGEYKGKYPFPPDSNPYPDEDTLCTSSGSENDDIEECQFFSRVSCCKYGLHCRNLHRLPEENSSLILIPNFFDHSCLKEDVSGSEETLIGAYKKFYLSVHAKFSTPGKIDKFFCCRNLTPHLKGNVYIEYEERDVAIEAVTKFNGTLHCGKTLSVTLIPTVTWNAAICTLFAERKCPRTDGCNFLHVFNNPGDENDVSLNYQLSLTSNPDATGDGSSSFGPGTPVKLDMVNECKSFSRVACCKFGSKCKWLHRLPEENSVQILIQNFFDHPCLDKGSSLSDGELIKSYEKFYFDVFAKFSVPGVIRRLLCCRNTIPHLRGNVYILYAEGEAATEAVRMFNGSFYNGKEICVTPIPKISYKSARCRDAPERCPRGSSCTSLHVFTNPRKPNRRLLFKHQSSSICKSYALSGICGSTDSCTLEHPIPNKSSLLLLPNIFQHPKLNKDSALDKGAIDSYNRFYDDFIIKLRKAGPVLTCKCIIDKSEHLRGNLYVQYSSHEIAERSIKLLQPNFAQLCHQIVWPTALCETYNSEKECKTGGCDLLHALPNPRDEYAGPYHITEDNGSSSSRRHRKRDGINAENSARKRRKRDSAEREGQKISDFERERARRERGDSRMEPDEQREEARRKRCEEQRKREKERRIRCDEHREKERRQRGDERRAGDRQNKDDEDRETEQGESGDERHEGDDDGASCEESQTRSINHIWDQHQSKNCYSLSRSIDNHLRGIEDGEYLVLVTRLPRIFQINDIEKLFGVYEGIKEVFVPQQQHFQQEQLERKQQPLGSGYGEQFSALLVFENKAKADNVLKVTHMVDGQALRLHCGFQVSSVATKISETVKSERSPSLSKFTEESHRKLQKRESGSRSSSRGGSLSGRSSDNRSVSRTRSDGF